MSGVAGERSTAVRLTSLDRILWPEVGWTKGQLVDYYAAVSGVLLPHLRGRPLTLGRWPEGVDGKGWYQTNCRGAPSWLRTADIPASRGDATFRMCLVDDFDSLLWVANQGTVELHPYLSTADAFDEPLVLVFDLDPGEGATLAECARVALWLRELLAGEALRGVAKTSGARGLHVYVPTDHGTTFADTRSHARRLAAELAQARPDAVTETFSHAARQGRVLIDWRQNERARSQVAPYSLRATPWPLVSTPLDWAEVEEAARTGDTRPLYFAPEQAVERLSTLGDLFAPALDRPTIGA